MMLSVTPGREQHDGFALIEVMLALMLIAVLAALSLPSLIRANGPAALRIASFQISALMREDRNLARSTGKSTVTLVAPDGRRVLSVASSALVDLPSGVTATAARAIRFFADGHSSGGEILLSNGDANYAVVVRRDTGAIRVVEP